MKHQLKEIKLIVIDIDGTLVDVYGKVGEKSLQIAKELKKFGILCTLSSARSFFYSAHIAEELDIDIPFITLDGALIKDRHKNVVYRGAIRDWVIQRAISLSELNYGKITMCDEHNLYITPRNAVIKEYTRLSAPVKEVPDFNNVNNVLEILIYCEDKSSVRAIKNKMNFPHSIGISVGVTKSPNNEYYLVTIKKKGSDKLKSVKRLVKQLKLKRKNIAVIGDWHNDMPLFDYGAFNIAVQNAIPELKRKADYVTKCTNNEDAVGEVLEMILKYKTSGAKFITPEYKSKEL
jgi:Cof subfamily protein (haloacid dehalogenase superfamily)